MFCGKCGKQMEAGARFCSMCGTPKEAAAPPPPSGGAFRASGQLVRPRTRRMIGGVCAGFADHYGWDLNVVRLVTVLLTFFTVMTPVLVYIAAWIIIPEGQYALPFGAPPPPPASGATTTGTSAL